MVLRLAQQPLDVSALGHWLGSAERALFWLAPRFTWQQAGVLALGAEFLKGVLERHVEVTGRGP